MIEDLAILYKADNTNKKGNNAVMDYQIYHLSYINEKYLGASQLH